MKPSILQSCLTLRGRRANVKSGLTYKAGTRARMKRRLNRVERHTPIEVEAVIENPFESVDVLDSGYMHLHKGVAVAWVDAREQREHVEPLPPVPVKIKRKRFTIDNRLVNAAIRLEG